MKQINKFVYWTPRILSIIFICFLALFSLDVFGNGLNFWQTILGLLIHNIPVMFLVIILIISWKREIVGGIVFILAGLLYIVMLLKGGIEPYQIFWILPISGPAFLIGVLFIIGWFKKKNK
jgi:hypothetical protein